MAVIIQKYVSTVNNRTLGKTYGRVRHLGNTEIDELSEMIEEKCTVHKADVLAVLSALATVVRSELQNSKRVVIPYIGAFKLMARSTGEENAANFSNSNIKGLRVVFQPYKTYDGVGSQVNTLTHGAKLKDYDSIGLGNGGVNNSNSGGICDEPVIVNP